MIPEVPERVSTISWDVTTLSLVKINISEEPISLFLRVEYFSQNLEFSNVQSGDICSKR